MKRGEWVLRRVKKARDRPTEDDGLAGRSVFRPRTWRPAARSTTRPHRQRWHAGTGRELSDESASVKRINELKVMLRA